jgi:hypothetical protein
MFLVEEANTNAVLTENHSISSFLLRTLSALEQTSDKALTRFLLGHAAILSQEKHDVFEGGCGRPSPVGRDEAVDSRRRVNCTQAEVGGLSRRSIIPSSGDSLWWGE